MSGAEARQLAWRLLMVEIERIVAEAQGGDRIVRAGYHAGQILRRFPASGFSRGRIINEITAAAATAGLPVEISRDE